MTPLLEDSPADFGLTGNYHLALKLELVQRSGSFKARGAAANLALRDVPPAGVAAASGGNHGAAVADAAAQIGVAASIFVPEIADPAKIERISRSGARLVVDGQRYVDALQNCLAYCAETGALNIHAYDQRETILGQATLGLELDQQMRAAVGPADMVLVAVGGGGLISGITAWFQDSATIVGVEPATSCALHAALGAGRPVDVEVSGLAADSLGARRIGQTNFDILRLHPVTSVTASDDDIRRAQALLWQNCRIVAEPGGATSLAALISGAVTPQPDSRVCAIVCGGNTDAVTFAPT